MTDSGYHVRASFILKRNSQLKPNLEEPPSTLYSISLYILYYPSVYRYNSYYDYLRNKDIYYT